MPSSTLIYMHQRLTSTERIYHLFSCQLWSLCPAKKTSRQNISPFHGKAPFTVARSL